MEVRVSSSEAECQPMVAESSPVGTPEMKLREVIGEGSLDFDEWTSLISDIEKTYPDDIEKICLVYDSFLSEFPLCYGYWRKYSDHKMRLCSVDKVVEVFERGVQSATYSVDMWLEYCCFGISAFEDPFDICRLFKRGVSFVGKDYLCHTLWDKYIEFEFSQQQWNSLAHIYIQTLKFPTKKLHRYYESFKKLTATWEEEWEFQSKATTEVQSEPVIDCEVPTLYKDDEISSVIKDLLDPSVGVARSGALQKYLSMGQHFYQEACQLDKKIRCFETHIRRSYFHVKPLDVSQLENWHRYLDFVEMHGDFDWVVKVYERCLIPCANYPEFWMRYVEYMETKGGREIANFALDRATQAFMKKEPVIHHFTARFKEQIGDVFGARAAFLQCETESDSNFLENVITKANMERRMGNFVAASDIYKEALETAADKKKLHILPTLYVHFARLKCMINDTADAARDILLDGIKHVHHCKLLVEELINFARMHGGSRHIHVVDSVIANVILPGLGASQSLSAKDKEEISSLYLEFVDLCGTIHDVRKAWNRHIKLFPCSTRTTTYNCPDTSVKLMKVSKKVRQESVITVPHQPSENFSADCPKELPLQDKKLSLSENDETQFDQVSDQKLSLLEDHDIQADEGEFQSVEVDDNVAVIVRQVSPKVSQQFRDNIAEGNESSIDLEHKVANGPEPVEVLQEYTKEVDVLQESNCESEKNLKTLSLEKLTLDPQDSGSLGSLPFTSHQCEAPQETCMSNGSMSETDYNTDRDPSLYSSSGIRVSDSAKALSETASPTLDSLQNPIPVQILSRTQVPSNSGRNWHLRSFTNKIRRESKFGYRGHSQKQHQQQQISPRKQYPQAEMGPQMPLNKGYPSQLLSSQNRQNQQGSQASNQHLESGDQKNFTVPHASPSQNVQEQNFAAACPTQLPGQSATYPQAQMSQYPMQGNQQYDHVQSSQAYNQMWQYYYYQQQQQQQQFLLQQYPLQQQQQQQSHELQQQQQPHEQQQQQQPQQQQQQQQPLQLQQPHEQQQLLQQYQQQHYLYQQQQLQLQQQLNQQQSPYQQQYNMQQHLELQQQQLLLLQQQQLQQQHVLYVQQQQPPPQEQPSQQHQVYRQVQEQDQQQIGSLIHSWNNSNEQGQSIAPSADSRSASVPIVSASPHPKLQSPENQ